MDYKEFLETKAIVATPTGFDIDKSELNENMFDFQKDLCKWALKKGKSAILIGCGCGKTIIQLEWAHQVHVHTGKSVLMLAPLSVVNQTAKEAEKFGTGWFMQPVDTDYCDKFGEMSLYVVAVKKDSTEIKATVHREPRRYGYINPVPKVTRYERTAEVALLAKDAKDAIDKALEILNGKEEHI